MYTGLMAYDSQGNPVSPALADVDIQEKGYIDEYSINFGGNISNTVYWGIGFGITDLDYKSESYYSESLDNANVPDEAGTSYVGGGAQVQGRCDYQTHQRIPYRNRNPHPDLL